MFSKISGYLRDRQNEFKNATCGRGYFSRKRRKNPPFSKISGYVWTGQFDLKTLRVDADFSVENGKKNLHFQKYPDTSKTEERPLDTLGA